MTTDVPVTDDELEARIARAWEWADENGGVQAADVVIERTEKFGPPKADAYGDDVPYPQRAVAAILRGEDPPDPTTDPDALTREHELGYHHPAYGKAEGCPVCEAT
jgi:hypothetical protein